MNVAIKSVCYFCKHCNTRMGDPESFPDFFAFRAKVQAHMELAHGFSFAIGNKPLNLNENLSPVYVSGLA